MSPEAVAAYDVELLTGSAAREADVLLQVRHKRGKEEKKRRRKQLEKEQRGRCPAAGTAKHILLLGFCAAQLSSASLTTCYAGAGQHHASGPCMFRTAAAFEAAQILDRFASYSRLPCRAILGTPIPADVPPAPSAPCSWPPKPRVSKQKPPSKTADASLHAVPSAGRQRQRRGQPQPVPGAPGGATGAAPAGLGPLLPPRGARRQRLPGGDLLIVARLQTGGDSHHLVFSDGSRQNFLHHVHISAPRWEPSWIVLP